MKITNIETLPVRLPVVPERAIQSSVKYTGSNTFVLVKIHTDEGLTGLGEVSCDAAWSGEASDESVTDDFDTADEPARELQFAE